MTRRQGIVGARQGKARQGIKNSIMCIEPNKTHWPGKCRAQTPVCFVDGFFRAEDKSWHWNTWRNVLRYAVGARTSKALFRLETWLGFGINFAVKCRRKRVWNGWKSSEERERERCRRSFRFIHIRSSVNSCKIKWAKWHDMTRSNEQITDIQQQWGAEGYSGDCFQAFQALERNEEVSAQFARGFDHLPHPLFV